MKRASTVLALILFLAAASDASALFGKPGWVRKRPVNAKYYIGIGMVRKADAGASFAQEAKNKALADLSSEISITVSGEFVDKTAERSGLSEEDIRSEIRAETQAELEAYDAVDSWQNAAEYWVYYRLDKAEYEKARQRRKETRSRAALDLWEKGLKSEAEGDAATALGLYVQALAQVEPYLGEGVEIQREGRNIVLTGEVTGAIQSLLGTLQLTPAAPRLKAMSGQSLGLDLAFTALRKGSDGKALPVSGLPVACAFVRGTGTVARVTRTDAAGAGACRLARIDTAEKVQVVLARPDLARLAAGEPSKLLRETLRKLSGGAARFELEVSGRPVFLDASETNMGEKVATPQFETPLEEAFLGLGFAVVEARAGAELVAVLRASARKESDFHGMCIAMLDATITVKDSSAGTELYRTALQNVRGMQFDCLKAGLKAYENALPAFKGEALPALIQKLKP